MNSDIKFIDTHDQARWFGRDDMTDLCLEQNHQNREMYDWLRNNTTGEVHVYSVGKLRIETASKPSRWGDFVASRHVFSFENRDEAMTFKLVWGGSDVTDEL